MPNVCYITCCKEEFYKQKGVTFHKLPSENSDLRVKWIKQIGVNITISKHTKICSRHFDEACFIRHQNRTKLHENAIPTLFLKEEGGGENSNEDTGNCIIFNNGKSPVSTPMHQRRRPRLLVKEFDEDLTVVKDLVNHDHGYFVSDPEKHYAYYKKKYILTLKKLEAAKKKIKLLQKKVNRSQRKIKNFSDIFDEMKKHENLTQDTSGLLNKSLEGAPKDLFNRYLIAKNAKTTAKFPPELRKFALTLNFLSNKGYEFIRNMFGNALPHRSTLSKWYSHVDGNPGICNEALACIRRHVDADNEKPVILALMFDDMSIRKHIDFDGQKNIGFIDYGLNFNQDNLPVAGHALVYMAVCINSNWKVPVSYYLIDTLTADERTSITYTVLESIHHTGASIRSLTCDAPAPHLNMATQLGVSFDVEHFNTVFVNPFSQDEIAFMLDACHVLKLIRGLLFHYRRLYDANGEIINVEFIILLQTYQQKEGLHFANKLTSTHINWQQQPMKVRLAAQTLSASVADAIDYCRDVLNLPQFQHSQATTNFIRVIDRLFDIFNTKDIFGKHYKAPLKVKNEHFWRPFLEESFEYLKSIKLENGQLLVHSRRKAGFLGLLSLIRSVQHIFDTSVKVPSAPLKYLLTYKCSQDHLELFFSSIRSRGGFNNNPTAKQFAASFKRLLVHHELKHFSANCLDEGETNILSVSSAVKGLSTRLDTAESDTCDSDFIIDYSSITQQLSQSVESIVDYIAGFIVRRILKSVKCSLCAEALTIQHSDNSQYSNCNVIAFKNRGGLYIPSSDVVKICTVSETACRVLMNNTDKRPSSILNLQQQMTNSIFSNLPKNIFSTLDNHLLDFEIFGENHVFELTKQIIRLYLKIRLHHINNLFNIQLQGPRCRQKLTKLVLFKHQ